MKSKTHIFLNHQHLIATTLGEQAEMESVSLVRKQLRIPTWGRIRLIFPVISNQLHDDGTIDQNTNIAPNVDA